jgi:outer membrane cobalamin receptor
MRVTFALFLLIFQLTALSQNKEQTVNKNSIALDIFLKKLETTYNVRFSYNPILIDGKTIAEDTKINDLKSALLNIENIYKIIFENIDDRYYTIKEQTKNIAICGYLIDTNRGTPIEGANIFNANTLKGAVSNQEGYFMIENNHKNDTLIISFIGYKTLSIALNSLKDKICKTYTLTLEDVALNEIVIKEYLGVGISKTIDGSIKIDPNNLEILSGLSEPDILQNIQLLSGIESPSETASGLYIRAGAPDQNLILWDGIKMYNSNHFFGMVSAFNPYIINNVKVSKGGTNPKYGDRISGVVDILTENKIPEKVEGQAGLNMIHGDIHLKIPASQKVGLIISTRRSLAELFRSPTLKSFSEKVFQNTSIVDNQSKFEQDFIQEKGVFYFSDFSLKTIIEPSKKDKITMSSLLTKNKLDYKLEVEGLTNKFIDKLSIENYGLISSWERLWKSSFTSKTNIYYSQYDFKYDGQYPLLDEAIITKKSNNIKEIGVNFHTDWALNDAFSLSNGYQFFSNKVSYSFSETFSVFGHDLRSPTHAIYSQLHYKKPQRWNIDIGLRANHYSAYNTTFLEPRIYAERLFGNSFRLKASAELKNQAVRQIVEFTTIQFGLENQVWALTEKNNIPFIRSDQVSLGFLYSNSGWHLDIDAYIKNIDGFTAYNNITSIGSFFDGNSLTKGIDVLFKKRIKNHSSWLGYTYSTTNFLFEGINEGKRFRGTNDIRHSLTWSHFYKWNNFQFSLGWKYRTGTLYTPANSFTTDNNGVSIIDYGKLNSKVLPDYHRLDLSVLYNFNLSKKSNAAKGKLGFSLLNIYNKKNILSRTYTLLEEFDSENNVNSIALKEINKYSLRRTPNIVFRVQF